MKSKSRIIILTLVTIICCLAVITAGTFALFTDSVSVGNHLQAGTLKISLVRTAHSNTLLNDEGYLSTTTVDNESVDFSAKTNENAFGLDKDSLIAPQSKLSATFDVKNNDTVAFGYWLEIVLVDKDGKPTQANDLAKQLKITLTGVDEEQTLGDGALTLGSENSPVAGVAVGKSSSFTVTIEFVDSQDNNLAQDQEVYFDLIVSAVQLTKAI